MLPFFVNYYQMPPHKILINNNREDVGVGVGVGVEVSNNLFMTSKKRNHKFPNLKSCKISIKWKSKD